MDNVLRNDLALALQLVSEKEKKTNAKVIEITKKIVSTVLDIKDLKRKKNAKK
jgi:hypothetical protein